VARSRVGDTAKAEEVPVTQLSKLTPAIEDGVADSPSALKHFENLLRLETDCWDVHASLEQPNPGFVLLDVRSPDDYGKGHVAGAVNLPHRRITESTLAEYPPDTIFIVYCAGPHCNGADKAAVRLARLGRPVKKMIGGIEGWKDEGFELTRVAARRK